MTGDYQTQQASREPLCLTSQHHDPEVTVSPRSEITRARCCSEINKEVERKMESVSNNKAAYLGICPCLLIYIISLPLTRGLR